MYTKQATHIPLTDRLCCLPALKGLKNTYNTIITQKLRCIQFRAIVIQPLSSIYYWWCVRDISRVQIHCRIPNSSELIFFRNETQLLYSQHCHMTFLQQQPVLNGDSLSQRYRDRQDNITVTLITAMILSPSKSFG